MWIQLSTPEINLTNVIDSNDKNHLLETFDFHNRLILLYLNHESIVWEEHLNIEKQPKKNDGEICQGYFQNWPEPSR